MRLISWNIWQGGGKRLSAQVEVIKARQPDFVALQEIKAKTAPLFIQQLKAIGLDYILESTSLAQLLPGSRNYGVLIASRYPLQILPALALPLPERVAAVVAETPFGALELHTTYIPVMSKGRVKLETVDGIYQQLKQPCPRPRLLCGDFNSPRLEKADGEVITFGQVLRKNGTYRVQNQTQDSLERKLLQGLAEFGMRDAFRDFHGYAREDHSWIFQAKGLRVGFRLDHIMASAEIRILNCQYLHQWREVRLSDHSAMELDFEF